MILLYTTHENKAEAEKITKKLFEKQLIACVNYSTIEASYMWEGSLQTENETVALYKTNEAKWKETEAEIAKLHPYDTPCIIKIDATANEAYNNWLNGVIS